jgi:hypothetical protein
VVAHGESICLNRCVICDRSTPKQYLEKHHLKTRKKSKECIQVCCDCADQIHKLFSNKELETIYSTLDSLLSNERMQKWIKWIRNKKEFGFCMKCKKKR